jgi:hypothetical protein
MTSIFWTKLLTTLRRYTCVFVFLSAFTIYGISAGTKITEQSGTPQYIYLADAFLQGHVDLVTLPERKFDLIFFQEKWYVPGGITPALLSIPFVFLFGKTFSDVFFGVLIGAINVTLMYSLLDTLVEIKSLQGWLTALFALGTTHWWLSSVGSVWFNAHVVALLFMILYARDAIKNKPWLAGLWLGLAFLARPPTIFSAVFYLLILVLNEHPTQKIMQKMAPFIGMLILSVTTMLAYNYLRFGSPLDFGYSYVLGTNGLTEAFAHNGGFNPRYMPCNIHVSLFGLPNINLELLPSLNETCSHLGIIRHDFGELSAFFNPLGMSIFLTTPAFLLIFRAKKYSTLFIPAWAGTISILIPLWMYHTTGWVQFGYRYITDVMVFIFILLTSAVKQIGLREKLLIITSIIMGAIGVYLMYYMTFEISWQTMFIEFMRKLYHFLF